MVGILLLLPLIILAGHEAVFNLKRLIKRFRSDELLVVLTSVNTLTIHPSKRAVSSRKMIFEFS